MIHPSHVEPTPSATARARHRAHVSTGLVSHGCTISKDVYVDTEVHVVSGEDPERRLVYKGC